MHNTVINTTDDTLMGASYIPGRFVPNSLCFGDITQQETYYIILVRVQAIASPDSMNSILKLVYMYGTSDTDFHTEPKPQINNRHSIFKLLKVMPVCFVITFRRFVLFLSVHGRSSNSQHQSTFNLQQ